MIWNRYHFTEIVLMIANCNYKQNKGLNCVNISGSGRKIKRNTRSYTFNINKKKKTVQK